MDVLVCQVGHSLYRAFLYRPFSFIVLVYFYCSYFISPGLVFADNLRFCDFHFFHIECASNDIDIVSHVILEVGIPFSRFPHVQDVILL